MKTPHPVTIATAAALVEGVISWAIITENNVSQGLYRSRPIQDHLLEQDIVSRIGDLATVILAIISPPQATTTPPTLSDALDRMSQAWKDANPETVAFDTMELFRDLQAVALASVENGRTLTRGADEVGVMVPNEWFDLLVQITGAIEQVEADMLPADLDRLTVTYMPNRKA